MAVAAMLCAIPGPALSAQAPCSDVSGSYDVMVTLPGGGPTAIILELAQEECGLTGFVGLTSRIPIQNGTVADSAASFTFEAENRGSGGTLEIRWEITISGDDVTGTFSHDMFGDIEVTGSRVPPGGGGVAPAGGLPSTRMTATELRGRPAPPH